jgi:multicomponent Na+:H+ antiporter subunit E
LKHLLSLALILTLFWLINSGHYTPLLLSFGALSVAGVILITRRMEHVDGKFVPSIVLSFRLPIYLFWLLIEIIKSNIDVVIRVWKGTKSITPTVFKVVASQKTDVYRVLYANSITMTPGTITLDVKGDLLEIHALTIEGAEGIQSGEMDRRVSQLETNT